MKKLTKTQQRSIYNTYEENLLEKIGNKINLFLMMDFGCSSSNQKEMWLEAYDDLDKFIYKYMEESLHIELLDKVNKKRDILLGKEVKKKSEYKPLTTERKVYDIETLKEEIVECEILIDTIDSSNRYLECELENVNKIISNLNNQDEKERTK